jgi:hypothetical protein
MAKRKANIILSRAYAVPVALYPTSSFDAEQLETFPVGTEFDVAPRTKRSNPMNRLYWQALSNVVAATDHWATKDHLHDALMRDLGYERVGYGLDGRPYITRDSAAFDSMTHEEFKVYFDKAMARLAEVTGCDPLAFAEAA